MTPRFTARASLSLIVFVAVGAAMWHAVTSGLLLDVTVKRLDRHERYQLARVVRKVAKLSEPTTIVFGDGAFIEKMSMAHGALGIEPPVLTMRVRQGSPANLQRLIEALPRDGDWRVVGELTPLHLSDYRFRAVKQETRLLAARDRPFTFRELRPTLRLFFDTVADALLPARPAAPARDRPADLAQLRFSHPPTDAPELIDALARAGDRVQLIESFDDVDESTNPRLFDAFESFLAGNLAPHLTMPALLHRKDCAGVAIADSNQPVAGLEGYPSDFTVPSGGVARIRYAGDASLEGDVIDSLTLRDMLGGQTYTRSLATAHRVSNAPCRSFTGQRGCDFPSQLGVSLEGVAPGLYELHLLTHGGHRSRPIYLQVTADKAQPEAATMAVLIPYFTWHAYSAAGGESFYTPWDSNRCPGPSGGRSVSLARPIPEGGAGTGDADFPFNPNSPRGWSVLATLLKDQGHDFRLVSSTQLEDESRSLDGVKLLVVLVHAEYWTAALRRRIEDHLLAGNHLLIVGGNTGWWRARRDGNVLVTAKDKVHSLSLDLQRGGRDSGLWDWPTVANPIEKTLGLTYRGGGLPLVEKFAKVADIPEEHASYAGLDAAALADSAGVTVVDEGHPLFEGLSIRKGDVVGKHVPLSWREIDGVMLDDNGVVDYQALPQAPASLKVIARTHAWQKFGGLRGHKIISSATIGEFRYQGKGTVLNLGSIGWVVGAHKKDAASERMIRNAIGYLLGK